VKVYLYRNKCGKLIDCLIPGTLIKQLKISQLSNTKMHLWWLIIRLSYRYSSIAFKSLFLLNVDEIKTNNLFLLVGNNSLFTGKMESFKMCELCIG